MVKYLSLKRQRKPENAKTLCKINRFSKRVEKNEKKYVIGFKNQKLDYIRFTKHLKYDC